MITPVGFIRFGAIDDGMTKFYVKKKSSPLGAVAGKPRCWAFSFLQQKAQPWIAGPVELSDTGLRGRSIGRGSLALL
jgi:hypothetical protein